MRDPVLFKIFLSSPGDVPQERDDADVVIQEINASGEFSSHFILKLYRWDDKTVVLPMPVTDIPQRSVDLYMLRPSECDLVVVLFWSRMGSALVMDERDYLSGTHYEYSEALEGYKLVGKPTTWLYRCSEEPIVKLNDPHRNEKSQQYDLVEQFFKQFRDTKGRYTGGVNEYATHGDFKALFKAQLLTYLRHLRDNPKPPLAPPKPERFTGKPYRGLNALTEDDAPIFFGREAETLDVLNRVDTKRLVFVLGASGSGKSSLVAAGVLPRLRQRGWQAVRCVPGDNPFYQLAFALITQCTAFGVAPVEYLPRAEQLANTLSARPENLAQQIAATFPKQKFLLFIDQFEEIFTLAEQNPRLPAGTVTTFLTAIRQPSDQLVTLLTMRADFYGAALPRFKELEREVFGLNKPSYAALYEMITRPAELAGLRLDASLADRIVDEAGTGSGALALVSYVLEALYLRAKARGDNLLSLRDYTDELGGVQGAINTLADRAYSTLPFAEDTRQKVLQNVFRELIALTEEDGQLIPTRRRAPLSIFDGQTEALQLIEQFVNARLLTKDGVAVEVAHEAILRHWNALADWITKSKGDIALLRQYERDAKTWDERGRDMPPPPHEALIYIYQAIDNLGVEYNNLHEPLKSYIESEQTRLLRELETMPKDTNSHQRRRDIGDRLALIGDTRFGVGLRENGIPDIAWLPIEKGGEISLEFKNRYDGEEHKFKVRFNVQPFFVSKYLVTFTQFEAFVNAPDGFHNLHWWKDMPERFQRQLRLGQRTKIKNAPCDTMSWYHAVAFARWLDAQYHDHNLLNEFGEGQWQVRLPTEWEWQWMAQGGLEMNPYPWGTWQVGYANTSEAGLSRTTAVGMYPHGAAKCGALDIAGNLYEWCLNDDRDPGVINYANDASKGRRGGSFAWNEDCATCTHGSGDSPGYMHNDFGLRLVVATPI